MSALNASFDVDTVDKQDNLVLVAVDAGFCRTVSEALLNFRERFSREDPEGRPNPACHALGHQIQQAGYILAGDDASKFPKLAGKVVDGEDCEDEDCEDEDCEDEVMELLKTS